MGRRRFHSASELIDMFDLSIDPSTLFRAMIRLGLMREVEYESTTGSGVLKSFKEITPDGLKYGGNKATMHEFMTAPRLYIETFPALMSLVVKSLGQEVERMTH